MIQAPAGVTTFLHWAIVITFVYSGVLACYAVVMGILAVMEAGFRRNQDHAEDYESVLESAHSIPVSIIAPSYNEELMAGKTKGGYLARGFLPPDALELGSPYLRLALSPDVLAAVGRL